MSASDDNPSDFTHDNSESTAAEPKREEHAESSSPPIGGDPIAYAGGASMGPKQLQPHRALPDDLRISWSWAHFIVFVLFGVGSFVTVQTALALYYAPRQHLSPKQLEQYLLNKPEFLFGSNIIFYALIFLFLYMTLGVLRGAPFWISLGWKKLRANISGGPWLYFFGGCVLSVAVFIAGSQVHGTEDMPIQQVLKNPKSAMLLMAMAVFVAPLVEETVFRGYLYPLLAKTFGIAPAIFITGGLFGLMHGWQLGWTWGIVLLLIVVGVIFTFARAYTGTVFASYLLHLGYNSMIAISAIISTKGFTHIPTR